MTTSLAAPTLDVVIAVHDPRRQVGRVVSSVLSGAGAGVRAVVVCHGIRASAIESQLPAVEPGSLSVIEFADRVPSPAGPFNAGLDAASADYVMVMGSDDFLERGAVTAWRNRLRADPADVLIVEQRMQSGSLVRTPLVRPWRSRGLDVARDRLFSRTAPLALMRRGLIEELGLRLTTGMRTGEDIAFSARLWTAAGRIDLARNAPRYVIGADADERVTGGSIPVETLLEPVRRLLAADWVGALPRRIRRSLAIKLLRVHLLGATIGHPAAADWTAAARAAARETLDEIIALEPSALGPLAVADRRLLGMIATAPDAAALARAIALRLGAPRSAVMLPRNPLRAADRESVPMRYLTYALDRSRLGVSRGATEEAR
jgi:Glycosyltransferases, probably involved in cell wall biogenesis